MKTRTVGGLEVSVIGLGCNNFGCPGFITGDITGTKNVLDACIEHGVTFLDTAAMYGSREAPSESLMGEALQSRRDKVVLATKWGHTAGPEPADWGARGSAAFIRKACETSLTRLRTDHIDLFQMHEPDPSTPIAETLQTLDSLRRDGKIRAYGCSNFSADQIRESREVADQLGVAPFVTAQNQYSLLARGVEADVLPAVHEAGMALLPYFPLASGLLTGKYHRDKAAPADSRLGHQSKRYDAVTPAQWEALERYAALCDGLGLPMIDVTIAWLLAHDDIASVIAGATRPEQVAQNAAASEVTLTPDTVTEISDIFA